MTNNFLDYRSMAAQEGVKVRLGSVSTAHFQGIHLIQPSDEDFHDALDNAIKDGFKTIFIHTEHPFEKSLKEIGVQS